MSVSQVAEESGVSRSTIFRMIQTGDGMLYSWQAVARALGTRASELIGGEHGGAGQQQ